MKKYDVVQVHLQGGYRLLMSDFVFLNLNKITWSFDIFGNMSFYNSPIEFLGDTHVLSSKKRTFCYKGPAKLIQKSTSGCWWFEMLLFFKNDLKTKKFVMLKFTFQFIILNITFIALIICQKHEKHRHVYLISNNGWISQNALVSIISLILQMYTYVCGHYMFLSHWLI